jgi:hypothetical protein
VSKRDRDEKQSAVETVRVTMPTIHDVPAMLKEAATHDVWAKGLAEIRHRRLRASLARHGK